MTEQAVADHLRHLKVRNLRSTSIRNRRTVLESVTRWADGPILHLDVGRLREWQDQRTDEVSPQMVRFEMSQLRSFYAWAVKQGLRPDNPADGDHLDMPLRRVGLPRPMPERDVAAAMGSAPLRVRTILALAALAGLRACEIARLDWADVNLDGDDPNIRIMDGKGGKGRVVGVSTTLAGVLAEQGERRGPVITRPNGKAGYCPPHRISQLANQYLHSHGVTATLHQCRHRFATRTYAASRDIRAVQEMMGHSSPKTTAIYAAASSDVARRAVEAAGQIMSPSAETGG